MIDGLLRRILPPLRYATAAVCAYEAAAIVVDHDRFPTFSKLAGRYRLVGPALMVALACHLLYPLEYPDAA